MRIELRETFAKTAMNTLDPNDRDLERQMAINSLTSNDDSEINPGQPETAEDQATSSQAGEAEDADETDESDDETDTIETPTYEMKVEDLFKTHMKTQLPDLHLDPVGRFMAIQDLRTSGTLPDGTKITGAQLRDLEDAQRDIVINHLGQNAPDIQNKWFDRYGISPTPDAPAPTPTMTYHPDPAFKAPTNPFILQPPSATRGAA